MTTAELELPTEGDSTASSPATMKAMVYHGPGKCAWEPKPRLTSQDPADAIVRVTTSTIPAEELVFRDVVEDVLIHPERVRPSNAWNLVSIRAIQLAGGVTHGQGGVSDPRVGNHTGIETKLPRHPLTFLLRQCGGGASQECAKKDNGRDLDSELHVCVPFAPELQNFVMLLAGGFGYFLSVSLYSATALSAGPPAHAKRAETLRSSCGSISML